MNNRPPSNPYLTPRNSPITGPLGTKRCGCLAALFLLASATAALLYCTQYVVKERGFRLENYHAGKITWNVWSYGNWQTTREGAVTVETYEPPYTILLAISPDGARSGTVEVLQAALIGHNGDRKSVVAALVSRREDVILRPYALVRQPYAVFNFTDLLSSHQKCALEVELKITTPQSDQTLTQQITVPAYETKRHSFTFWEALMGI